MDGNPDGGESFDAGGGSDVGKFFWESNIGEGQNNAESKEELKEENGNFKFRSPIIRWNSPLQRWRLLFHIAVLYSNIIGIAVLGLLLAACGAPAGNVDGNPDGGESFDAGRFSMSKYIPGNQKHLTLDDGSQNESMSISNQKLMLKDYAEKNGMPRYHAPGQHFL